MNLVMVMGYQNYVQIQNSELIQVNLIQCKFKKNQSLILQIRNVTNFGWIKVSFSKILAVQVQELSLPQSLCEEKLLMMVCASYWNGKAKVIPRAQV